MRIDKYIGLRGGYVRFANRVEFNYCFSDWAIPFGVQFGTPSTLFFQVLFLTLIIRLK